MKKLFLLPVLLLALTACGTTPSSSSEEPSSSSEEPSSSSEFVADTRVWRLVGNFGTSGWDPANDTYLLTRVSPTVNQFEITVDDFYKDQEFQIVKNGLWDGQLGFSTITSMDPAGCFIEGSGYATKNAKAAQDGKYHIVLDTSNTFVPNISVHRLGDPTNPAPTETLWRLAGSMNSWAADNDSYLFTETATPGTYEFTLDLYVGDIFKLTRNGSDWVGADKLGTITPAGCVAGTDNIEVAQHGNYTIQVVDADPDVINVTRLGDPIVPPVQEVDNGGWYLTGTINSWTVTDTTYALALVSGTEHTYEGVFEFAADAEFVINAGGSYDLKRGPSKVQTTPAPVGIDLTGDNIKVTTAGTYKVTFTWATDMGGVIVIVDVWNGTSLPEGGMTISAILAEATTAKVYTTRGIIVGINGGSIFLEDASGNALNVYNGGTATLIIKDEVKIGNVVDAVGSYKLYNNAAELDAANLTFVATAAATLITPFVIADAAALTARMGTNYALSGQLVRLNGVTVGPVGTPSNNNYVITFGTTTVTGYSFFSLAYETATPATGTGRTAINTAIAALNTAATTFNVVGVLYSSNSSGLWKLGITNVSMVNVA